MSKVSCLVNEEKIVVFLGGRPHEVYRENEKYGKVKQALKSKDVTEAEIGAILNPVSEKVEQEVVGGPVRGSWLDGRLVLQDGVLKYDGDAVHENLQKRFLQTLEEDLPVESIANFIANVDENPSRAAQEELYDFLVYSNLGLTEDGCILAYKAVTSDFMDKHTRSIDNSVGQTVRMKRNKVDDDRRHACSNGLHCGALEYVSSFGHGNDKCVIVKVNPKDVVSVPFDYDCQKMRVAEYLVLGEYKGEMTRSVYKADGDNYLPEKYDDYEDDYDDDDDYYDEFEDSYDSDDVESYMEDDDDWDEDDDDDWEW